MPALEQSLPTKYTHDKENSDGKHQTANSGCEVIRNRKFFFDVVKYSFHWDLICTKVGKGRKLLPMQSTNEWKT